MIFNSLHKIGNKFFLKFIEQDWQFHNLLAFISYLEGFITVPLSFVGQVPEKVFKGTRFKLLSLF